MVRLTYLFPRIIILGLIIAAVWVSADPLAKTIVVSQLERAVGAKVDIGTVRYSPAKQKLYIKEVSIADPRSPMTNLIQADMAYLNFDKQSLLNRTIVVDNGQTSNVVFGAPRTESGELPGQPTSRIRTESATWFPLPFENGDKLSQTWVDKLQLADNIDPTSLDLQISKVATSVSQEWQNRLNAIDQAVRALQDKTKLARLQMQDSQSTTIQTPDGIQFLPNPLRKEPVMSVSNVEYINRQSKVIAEQIFDLQNQVIKDREAIIRSHETDIKALEQSGYVSNFDHEAVSQLLLTEMHQEFAGEILGWFQWFQSALPDPRTDLSPQTRRGVNVVFEGTNPKPDFLIKSIDLEGEGWLAAKHVRFAGTAYNLTSQPDRHSEPASFDLRAQGDEHVLVSCVLDRRNQISIDTLGIVCPDLELPARLLGHENSMLVTMGPESRLQAEIKIQLIDDKVQGEVIFRHSNVSLHVDQLHEMAGGKNTALQMNQGLASLKQFESRVELTGTLTDYQCHFESDIGSQFAKAVDGLLSQKTQTAAAQKRKQVDQILQLQLRHIDENVLPAIENYNKLLEAETIELAKHKPIQPKPPQSKDANHLR